MRTVLEPTTLPMLARESTATITPSRYRKATVVVPWRKRIGGSAPRGAATAAAGGKGASLDAGQSSGDTAADDASEVYACAIATRTATTRAGAIVGRCAGALLKPCMVFMTTAYGNQGNSSGFIARGPVFMPIHFAAEEVAGFQSISRRKSPGFYLASLLSARARVAGKRLIFAGGFRIEL